MVNHLAFCEDLVNLSFNPQQHLLGCEDINKLSPAALAETAELIIVILMAICPWV